MPVDPQLSQVLLQLSQAPQPGSPEEMRASVRANAARRPNPPASLGWVRAPHLPGPPGRPDARGPHPPGGLTLLR